MTVPAAAQPGDPHARCGNTEPHGEHEWYGDPAAIRRTCPGLSAQSAPAGSRRVTLRIVKRERRAPDLHLPAAEEEAP